MLPLTFVPRFAGRYAHQGTTVYMLTQLPEGTERKVGYDASGWTTYERRSAEQIKKFYLYEAQWKLVLDLGAGENAETARNWPLDPDGFDALIEEKQFTNGADKGAVQALFRRMSVAQLGGIKKLDFDGFKPPTVEDAQQLGRCLSLCQQLEVCDLRRVGMTDEACAALFSTLASGSLGALTYLALNGTLPKLALNGNSIGDAGVSALAGALASGSLPALQTVVMYGNPGSDAPIKAALAKFHDMKVRYL